MHYLMIIVCFALTACSKPEEQLVNKFRDFEVSNESFNHSEILSGHNVSNIGKFKETTMNKMKNNIPKDDKGQFKLVPTDKGAALVFTTQDFDLCQKTEEFAKQSEGGFIPLPGQTEIKKHIECNKELSGFSLSMPLRTNF